MKYTQIPSDAFEKMQLNAGILVKSVTFTSGSPTIGDIIGATSGGIQFTATPNYKDIGENVDNCPKNTMELKRIDYIEATMSGTFVTVDSSLVKSLVGAADVSSDKITPRADLATTDFSDVWWIGDYSDVNTGTSAGYVAIHLMNALNTDGFKIQSNDKDKGTFAFKYTAHYSMAAQDTVPFEIYISAGTAA